MKVFVMPISLCRDAIKTYSLFEERFVDRTKALTKKV